jgi:hypothetical protein
MAKPKITSKGRKAIEPATITIPTGTFMALCWIAAPALLHERYLAAEVQGALGALPNARQSACLLWRHFDSRAKLKASEMLEKLRKGPMSQRRTIAQSNMPALEVAWLANFESEETREVTPSNARKRA